MNNGREITRTFVAATTSGRKYVIEEVSVFSRGGEVARTEYRLQRTGRPVRRRPDGRYEVWSLDYLILEEVQETSAPLTGPCAGEKD